MMEGEGVGSVSPSCQIASQKITGRPHLCQNDLSNYYEVDNARVLIAGFQPRILCLVARSADGRNITSIQRLLNAACSRDESIRLSACTTTSRSSPPRISKAKPPSAAPPLAGFVMQRIALLLNRPENRCETVLIVEPGTSRFWPSRGVVTIQLRAVRRGPRADPANSVL